MKASLEPTQSLALAPGSIAPQWLWWSALAITATLMHTMIDAHIGLWGAASDEMSALQAANTIGKGAFYGWWLLTVVLASHGDRWALRSVLIISVAYAFLGHGLIAFFAAPPPSAAFPYQDLAHAVSLLSGGVAALLVRTRLRSSRPGGKRYLLVGTVIVFVVTQALSALVFFQTH